MEWSKEFKAKVETLKSNIQAYLDCDDNPHDTSEHADKANQIRALNNALTKLEQTANVKNTLSSFAQQLDYSKQVLAQQTPEPLAEALENLGELFSKLPNNEQGQYKSELMDLSKQAEPILANSAALSLSKAGNRECGDYHGGGWNPFVRVSYFSPSCTIQYANLDINSKQAYTSDWARDDVNTALFKVFSWAVVYRVGKVFKKVQWVAAALGISNAVVQGYTGAHIRYRIQGETINFHNWYGKYKYNAITGSMLAVDFQGKGPAKTALIAPFQMQYGLFEADGTCHGVISEKWNIPGINISDYTVLPEKSFGTF